MTGIRRGETLLTAKPNAAPVPAISSASRNVRIGLNGLVVPVDVDREWNFHDWLAREVGFESDHAAD